MVKYLKSVGCKVIKLVVGSNKGNADLLICYRGLYLEFEMKQPGKHATPLQELKGRETTAAKGLWFEIHSVDEAKEAIAKADEIYGKYYGIYNTERGS